MNQTINCPALKAFRLLLIGTPFIFAGCSQSQTYHCKEGTEFTVIFTHHHAQLHIQNKVFELNQKKVFEGKKYTNGKITFGIQDGKSFVFDSDQMVDYACEEK